ncbi:MAG: PIN domain-containing protein [Candidatus Acidiferrales bacterium]
MKWFFDTSVLVPAFLEDHEHHERSLEAFLRADKKHGCCAAHGLAEFYAVVTRLPGRYRMSGDQVMLLIQNIRDRLAIISLAADEYLAVLEESAGAGGIGGTVYDALLMRCANKSSAETIYTWNVKHFQQFGGEISKRVRTP